MAGFALLFAWIMRTTLTDPDTLAAMAAASQAQGAGAGAEGASAGAGGFGGPGGGGMGAMLLDGISAVNIVTLGLQFAQLTVAVLGVLMITNEYSSGMIRATFAAAPHRGRVLVAKLLVLLLTTALLTIVGLALSWLITRPMMNDVDLIIPVDFGDANDIRALIGAVLFLMAIAALSLGIGALIRATAGGIFTVVALLMVLPMIFQIIVAASSAEWAQTVNRYLPTQAGERVYQVGNFGSMGGAAEMLAPWPGFFVLLAYAAIAFIAAFIVMRRRDA
jgi:ABC-2 type transport system permease protein